MKISIASLSHWPVWNRKSVNLQQQKIGPHQQINSLCLLSVSERKLIGQQPQMKRESFLSVDLFANAKTVTIVYLPFWCCRHVTDKYCITHSRGIVPMQRETQHSTRQVQIDIGHPFRYRSYILRCFSCE